MLTVVINKMLLQPKKISINIVVSDFRGSPRNLFFWPLLVIIYVNDLVKILSSSADETVLLSTEELSKGLVDIAANSRSNLICNYLVLNVNKTVSIPWVL